MLSLFRTQRIVKIYLELDSTASKLTAEVSAENGGADHSCLLNLLKEQKRVITSSTQAHVVCRIGEAVCNPLHGHRNPANQC